MLFRDINSDPYYAVEFDQGQVCRWINGLAKLSPSIISFYQNKENQWDLSQRIQHKILPLMPDSAMAAQELYDLVLQAPNVSPQKKMELTDGYTFEDENDEAIFIMDVLCIAMESSLQRLEQAKAKYQAELDAVLLQFRELAAEAESTDKAELHDQRQLLRKPYTKDARAKIIHAHGDQYNVLTMLEAEQDVDHLLREDERKLAPPVQKPPARHQPEPSQKRSKRDYVKIMSRAEENLRKTGGFL